MKDKDAVDIDVQVEYKHLWTGGWSKLVNPIVRALQDSGCTILQTKEKFGSWRCYFTTPENMSPDMVQVLHRAIDDTERTSQCVCIHCGSTPAKLMYDGWILPLCEKHAEEEGREWDNGEKPKLYTNMYKIEEKA